MAARIDTLVDALNELGKAILSSTSEDRTMQVLHGWNFPPLNRTDLKNFSTNLADRLSRISDEKFNANFKFDPLIERIEYAKANTIPHFWDGNATVAVPSYLTLIAHIENTFSGAFIPESWTKLSAEGLLPKQLNGKILSYNRTFKRLDEEISTMNEKLKYINEIHDAALEFPTDLENLKANNEQVTELKSSAEKNEALASIALERIQSLLDSVVEKEREATKLLQNTEDAYSAATTKGLGEAFQQRANGLSISMWAWVFGLMFALAVGAFVGGQRVEALQALISQNASYGVIWLDLMLAFISVAAPVWFAWLATKQIGHRFRLSEDYAFKASVAKAYEGYRREAARLDPAFATRLFRSALDRIEEPPIRFVENETFGSPWHEVIRMRQKAQASSSLVQQPANHSSNASIVLSTKSENKTQNEASEPS